jgi:hypothetical protein
MKMQAGRLTEKNPEVSALSLLEDVSIHLDGCRKNREPSQYIVGTETMLRYLMAKGFLNIIHNSLNLAEVRIVKVQQ